MSVKEEGCVEFIRKEHGWVAILREINNRGKGLCASDFLRTGHVRDTPNYLKALVKLDILKEQPRDNRTIDYWLTEKGQEFIDSYNKTMEMVR